MNFKSKLVVAAVAMFAASTALATPVCNGNAECNTTTNTTNNDFSKTYNQGGTGVGVGIGSVKNSGNSFNDIRNTNTNLNTLSNRQDQSQNQGQLQGQKQNSVNINKNTAKGGSATVNNYIGGGQGEEAAPLASSSVNIAAAAPAPSNLEIKTPGTAFAPHIYPTSPCMGSASAGVSFMGGGLSGGNTWKDDDCSFRETARMFHQLGYVADGIAVMCESSYAKSAPSCKKLAAQAAAELAAMKVAVEKKQLDRREQIKAELAAEYKKNTGNTWNY